MTKPARQTLPELIQAFFTQWLEQQRQVSPHTRASDRDTFRLLLRFMEQRTGRAPAQQRLTDWEAPALVAFLDHLEQQRHCQPCSRNIRLAALRSFMRYVAQQEPGALAWAQRGLAIPLKRHDRRLLGFLTPAEVEAILAATDPTPSGRRDHLLFHLLYHTGARISEALGLQRQDLLWQPRASVQLHGKGRKQRAVPLPPAVAAELKAHLAGRPGEPTTLVFCNRWGETLTRSGVEKRLGHTVQKAVRQCPSLKGRSISPHTFRHACAMQLLQADVDITVIALFLGHESPCTAHRYVELDMQLKEQCLKKLPTLQTKTTRFKPSDRLLAFLDTLQL
jgi:site-specific recombinase XerD